MNQTADKTRPKRQNYTEIYTEYYPYVYNTVYTKVGNSDDAHDICQEIFIVFYEKFEEVENHRKWLWGTMRNFVLKYFERKRSTLDIDSIFVMREGNNILHNWR